VRCAGYSLDGGVKPRRRYPVIISSDELVKFGHDDWVKVFKLVTTIEGDDSDWCGGMTMASSSVSTRFSNG